MKKKLILTALTIIMTLLFNISAFAADNATTFIDPDIKNFSKNSLEKRLAKLEKIKQDRDFKILDDFGDGTFSFTSSEAVKTEEDFDRYLRKVNGFLAQGTNTAIGDKSLTVKNSSGSTLGTIRQYFKDTVVDTNPIIGAEEISVDGSGFTSWSQVTLNSNYTYWQKLDNTKDSFKFDYDTVSSSTTVTVSPDPTASKTWSKGTASSTYTINWSDTGVARRADRVYGTVYCRTNNITGYTHSSSTLAVFYGNYQANPITTDYVSIW